MWGLCNKNLIPLAVFSNWLAKFVVHLHIILSTIHLLLQGVSIARTPHHKSSWKKWSIFRFHFFLHDFSCRVQSKLSCPEALCWPVMVGAGDVHIGFTGLPVIVTHCLHLYFLSSFVQPGLPSPLFYYPNPLIVLLLVLIKKTGHLLGGWFAIVQGSATFNTRRAIYTCFPQKRKQQEPQNPSDI